VNKFIWHRDNSPLGEFHQLRFDRLKRLGEGDAPEFARRGMNSGMVGGRDELFSLVNSVPKQSKRFDCPVVHLLHSLFTAVLGRENHCHCQDAQAGNVPQRRSNGLQTSCKSLRFRLTQHERF